MNPHSSRYKFSDNIAVSMSLPFLHSVLTRGKNVEEGP